MFRSVWQKWLKQFSGGATRTPVRRAEARARRPQVELLEDRVTPVTNITVIPGAAGTGTLDGYISVGDLAGTPGVIDSGDADVGANTLSTGALAAVPGNIDISITADRGITFADLTPIGGALQLQTGLGKTATFEAKSGAGTTLTFTNPANLVGTAGGNLHLASLNNISVANLASNNGGIEVVANNITVNQTVDASDGFVVLTATGNVTGTGAINADALAVRAATGISLSNANATLLAFENTTSGSVSISRGSVGGMTVAAVDGLLSSANAAGSVALATSGGPLTFAVNTSSVGNLTATAGDTGLPGDNLTLNPGVTVSSSAGNVNLTAGDDLVFPDGATVSAANGAVSLAAGINADSFGSLTVSGTVVGGGAGKTHTFSAILDVALDALLNLPGSTVAITSTQGAIVDTNDDTQPDLNNVIASNLVLSAARGIGSSIVPANPLEVTVDTLRADNTVSGDVLVEDLTGDLTVRGTHAGIGPFSITLRETGRTLTVESNDIVTAAGGAPVILTADNIRIPSSSTINAGTGIVTLRPLNPARPIELGTAGGAGTFGLLDSELDQITSGVTRIGGPDQTGAITFAAPITAPAGRNTNLSLQTAAAITQTTGATISGPAGANTLGLALQSGTQVDMTLTGNEVDTLAGEVLASGGRFTFFETDGLTIGSVDGVNGIRTTFAKIDVETFAVAPSTGPITVANTAAGTDIDSTGGPITLVARGAVPGFTLAAGAVISSGGGAIEIQADNMALNGGVGGIFAGIGRTTLRPANPGVQVNFGGPDSPVAIGLTPAELATVVAGTLQVGDATTGNIVLATATNLTTIQNLSLQTAAGVQQGIGAAITVPNLAIRAGNAVTMPEANNVTGSLAATVTTGGQQFLFNDANSLTIGTVDGLAGVSTSNAPITIIAGGSGTLTLDTNVTALAGAIDLRVNGANGTLVNNATVSNLGLNPITLTADRMAIGVGAVMAGGGGRVTLGASSPGRLIDLGSNTDAAAGALELSATELASVTTSGVFQVGNPTTGAVSVTAPVSIGAAVFAIVNNGSVTATPAGTITTSNLRVTSGGPVVLTGNNDVNTVAAQITGVGNGFTFNDIDDLLIGNVDGVSGITTLTGPIVVSTIDGNLTLNNNVLSGAGPVSLTAGGTDRLLTINPLQVFGSSAALVADRIAIVAPAQINVGTGPTNVVTLNSFTAGRAINLGVAGDPPGSLSLTDAELDLITAGILRIGNPAAGAITISEAITVPNTATTLSLVTGGTVTSTGLGRIAASNLAVQAGGAVNLTANPNTVTTNLAGTTTADPFRFVNTTDLFVNTADGVNGITTAGGLVELTAAIVNGTLGVQQPIAAGNANVTLTADDINIQAAVNSGTSRTTLRAFTPSRVVTIGTNVVNTLSLVDAELDQVTAAVLRVGDQTATANINIGGQITQGGYGALSLVTGGQIVDTTTFEQVDLTVDDLAFDAGSGIGSGNDLNLSGGNIVARTNTGNINLTGVGTLTVLGSPGIDGVTGVTNNGSGGITLVSMAGVGLGVGAIVQSGGGGTITLTANSGAPNGTANVTLGNNAQILTAGNIVINADPDLNQTGGTIVSGTGVVFGGPGAPGTPASTISLTVAPDIALPTLTASTSITVVSTGGSIRDDGVDTTALDAPVINLTARGDIGGAAAIAVADVLSAATASPTATFKGALDIDLAGLTAINITQNAAGNIQIRGVGGLMNTGALAGQVPVGTGKQLAIIGATGLVVNTPLTVPAVQNTNLLLGAVNGPVSVNAATNNTGTGPTSVVSATGSVTFNAAVIGGATATVTVRAAGSIVDGTGAGALDVAGGPVNLQADGGPINADVRTTALTATTSNAGITVRSEAGTGLPVSNVQAGTGAVSLTANGGNLTDLNPNNLVPDVVGGTVSLTATGTGTIGTAAAPVEVNATVLNATTTNKNLFIVDTTAGVALGLVSAGTGTANIRVDGGPLTGTVDGNADIDATNVVLTGTNNAGIGGGPGSPVEIAANTLSVTTAGTADISVRDVSGGLTVTLAQTVNGTVTLDAAGAAANLTVAEVIAGGGKAVALSATGAVNGQNAGPADVTSQSLLVTAGNGVGTVDPLETAIATLAGNGGAGGFAVENDGAFTIGATGVTSAGNVTLTATESVPAAAGDDLNVPSGVQVTSTTGAVTLQAGDALNVPVGSAVSAFGNVTLVGGFNDDGNGGAVSLLGAIAGSGALIQGGAGADTFTINPSAAPAAVSVEGLNGADTFTVTPNPTTAFDVSGGDPLPGGASGDALDVPLGGVSNPQISATFIGGAGYSGSWTFVGSAQPITFDTIENLTPTSNLTVAITDGVTSAVPGTDVTYTVTVTNTGPSVANGAVFSLPLSPLLLNPTYTSVASGGATGNTNGTGSINNILNLPVGGSVVYTVVGRINPSATGTLTTTATLTAPATAPDLVNNVHTASDTNTLTPQANVGVTTTRSGANPEPGGRLVFSVTVTNGGPSDAQSVTFTNTLPAASVFSSIVQVSGPAFTLTQPAVGSNGPITGTIATLPAGASAVFTIVTKVFGPAGTQVPNTVTVATATPDPVPGNNTATAAATIGSQTGQKQIVVGTGNGGGPQVKVYDANTGDLIMDFFAYEDTFRGGVNVAQGDLNGDGFPEIIAGSGVGGGPAVKVFDGKNGDLLRSFFAYESTFRGGVNVATGDVTGDGVPDILAGSGVGGGPVVKVFDGVTGKLVRSFFAYEDSFRGGVIVSSGDVTGDGVADIIAGSGVGGGPAVKVFDGITGNLVRSFFAYPGTLRGGVKVASGDVNGDGFDDIITGSGDGGAPNVRVFDGRTGAMVQSYFVFDPAILTGVNVAAVDADKDGRADVVAGAGVGQLPLVSVFSGLDQSTIYTFSAFDLSFTGGVFVG